MGVLSPDLLEVADAIKARYPEGRERSAVIPLLYLVQSVEGSLTTEGLREVARLLGVTTAEVEGVATFYEMFRTRRTGAHVISICTNLSCALRGANDVLEAAHDAARIPHGEDTSEDGAVTIHEEECLGACDAAPVVQVDYASHDRVDPARVRAIVQALQAGEVPAPSRGRAPEDFRHASRILAGSEEPS